MAAPREYFVAWTVLQLRGHGSSLWHSCSKGFRGYVPSCELLLWGIFLSKPLGGFHAVSHTL